MNREEKNNDLRFKSFLKFLFHKFPSGRVASERIMMGDFSDILDTFWCSSLFGCSLHAPPATTKFFNGRNPTSIYIQHWGEKCKRIKIKRFEVFYCTQFGEMMAIRSRGITIKWNHATATVLFICSESILIPEKMLVGWCRASGNNSFWA